ncbi:Rpn family recombination-promoting nuclease/putative transposase [Paenibacillaceae bacterium WGS1546]|uniref:Rpn family recombination-promoting nuclease/putative transposase n=1 Tax=Cohnella sp. WGS1546 TaxID=3366810 RepID=UPI00372D5296
MQTPHDEAFKKLLQTFFAEFIELFFPELDVLLDHSHTRLLMQEQLVDIVGEEAKILDLLLETRYKALDAYILVHMEPQSSRQKDFPERMFIYFGRLFERHRKEHRLIIPIAIFTADEGKEEPDTFAMSIPGHEIVRFRYLKVELRQHHWKRFVDSENPVAAALLAKMGYNEKDKKEMRLAYLRMILRLGRKLDDARMALLMSVADLYFQPDREQDERMLRELMDDYPEEGEAIMELMPAWKRWGYEEGVEEGLLKGKEVGKAEGKAEGMAEERSHIVRKLLAKGFAAEQVADTLDLPIDEVKKLGKR